MKKALFCFVACVLIVALCLSMDFGSPTVDNEEFLRIHIRADSNDIDDQRVKHKVRDALVGFLTPYLTQTQTKQQALKTVSDLLGDLSSVATNVLLQNGFDYSAKAMLKRETFPTKEYDGIVLGAGEYDALVVNLGSGEGDNWWCVVYPPLCFVGGTFDGGGKIIYESKLKEIIKKFKQKYCS